MTLADQKRLSTKQLLRILRRAHHQLLRPSGVLSRNIHDTRQSDFVHPQLWCKGQVRYISQFTECNRFYVIQILRRTTEFPHPMKYALIPVVNDPLPLFAFIRSSWRPIGELVDTVVVLFGKHVSNRLALALFA